MDVISSSIPFSIRKEKWNLIERKGQQLITEMNNKAIKLFFFTDTGLTHLLRIIHYKKEKDP